MTKNFSYQSNISAFAQIFLQVFLIFLTSIGFFYFFSSINQFNFVFYVLSIIFIGTRMRALGNMMHECSHFSFVQNKKWNIFFGRLISIFDLSSFREYQISHKMHHKYLGVAGKDIDFDKYLQLVKPYQDKKIFHNSFVLFMFIVFNPLNWIYYVRTNLMIKEKNKLIFILIIGIFLFLHPYKVLTFFLVPYFTSYQAMKIASDFLDHHKVYFNKEIFFKTRNHCFKNKILNLIFFPRNDAYHLVHHMHPNTPVGELDKIHTLLLANNTTYSRRKHDLF
ncbi:MAG: fatty acid desaturase [Bdellovibrionota bacterium]